MRETGKGWRRRLSNLALGCLLASCGEASAKPAPAPYEVRDGLVTLRASTSIPFDTRVVEVGAPLAGPPVPARVITIESLTAPVFAPVAGRVVETLVQLGDRVKRGRKLVEVRSPDLPTLYQERESVGAALRVKRAEVERLQRMVEGRVGSEHDLMVARGELERLEIAARASSSRISSLDVALGKDGSSYFLLAPRDGAVVQLDALAGQVVGPERATPLATVASIDEVFVVGDVPQRDASDLRVGASAKVLAGFGVEHELEGHIEFVSEVVDPERQTVPVRVRVANGTRALRPNAYVELTFAPFNDSSVVRVPTHAVVSDGSETVVFVEADDKRYQRRSVELGRQTKDLAEVRKGLAPGERVVVSHALLLLNAVHEED